MGQLFGTDGVRGVAGDNLTAGLAMTLASAAASVLAGTGEFAYAREAHRRPVAVVGRDPRASGEFLEAAVVAGLAASGVDVIRLGVIPTPGVAYLTAALGADLGVMLSASHNPAPDNGIKFFARGGVKLPDEVENAIEARLGHGQPGSPRPEGVRLPRPDGRRSAQPAPVQAGPVQAGPVQAGPVSPNRVSPGPVQPGQGHAGPAGVPDAGFGRVGDAPGEGERYLEHLLATVPGLLGGRAREPLAGLRVVVDCANGAASAYAPELLSRAGADVIAIGAEPDGLNINLGCGSTSLSVLSAAVVEHGADAGIAHDGDADRCLAVDASGQVIDGDQILAVLALALKESGRLAGNTVVATVMSNLGFRHAMRAAGIEIVETPVGDRYLIAAMLDGKFVLGGEQSGHIIMLDHATTGDGLLTGLQLLAEAVRRDRPLADLARVMTRYPQVLISVPGVDKARVAGSAAVTEAVTATAAELGDTGRVIVRPSGTEPAVRVMVEAADSGQAERLAGELAAIIRDVG
jgi:phosphoglucosamine mutase